MAAHAGTPVRRPNRTPCQRRGNTLRFPRFGFTVSMPYMLSISSRFPALFLSLIVLCPLRAQTPAASPDFFENKIRPVLANNCYSCHTGSQLGGLRLDSRDAML